jgi:hypothetical protein
MIDRRVDFHAEFEGVVTITADLKPHVKDWCRTNLSGPISRDVFHRSAPRSAVTGPDANYLSAVGVDSLEVRFASEADQSAFCAAMKYRG